MKIVIAPDSFKECLTALEVAKAIEEGILSVLPDAECIKVPVADGGEGTARSLVDATGGQLLQYSVTGPLGQPVNAALGLLGDGETAVIEMAEASGLALVPPASRNPLHTTTYGTGELISKALDLGVRHLIIGIGGSATNDGGAGMMQALGIQFLDEHGNPIPLGGAGLLSLHRIDTSRLDPRLADVTCQVACDVNNPLTGPNGASHIFGPQKGAGPEQVLELDRALVHYEQRLQSQLGKTIGEIPGAGAAGGMGAALLAFLDATLQPGIDIVMEAVDLASQLQGADLVITGEGRIDGQTACGKTPVGVARHAKTANLPVIAIAGCLGHDHELVHAEGIDALFPAIDHLADMESILRNGYKNIRRTACNIAKLLTISADCRNGL
ncbi:glycerate kinase [Kistimonas scapharcae]|uniref:Glycerate kinase n=1 Tax=Kistimonas scapharcae TaxID=1036133 RepID=A0ABP8V3P0_9GAMM